MFRLECCRKECTVSYKDNWKGEGKNATSIDTHLQFTVDSPIQVNIAHRASDMKTARLCPTCVAEMKAWFELDWGTVASDVRSSMIVQVSYYVCKQVVHVSWHLLSIAHSLLCGSLLHSRYTECSQFGRNLMISFLPFLRLILNKQL